MSKQEIWQVEISVPKGRIYAKAKRPDIWLFQAIRLINFTPMLTRIKRSSAETSAFTQVFLIIQTDSDSAIPTNIEGIDQKHRRRNNSAEWCDAKIAF